LYACCGVLFNHESPRRGETFVTRKITRALARIKCGLQSLLSLGNLDAKRDWGHARDYVEMQWLMLQQDSPRDYVIATGQQYTVRHFVELACKFLEMPIEWRGEGVETQGFNPESGKTFVAVDPRYFRPTEVDTLLGDPTEARELLGWKPKTSFEELVREMIEEDEHAALSEQHLADKGANLTLVHNRRTA
jgi:GDPmannose 4,6-dehydratase